MSQPPRPSVSRNPVRTGKPPGPYFRDGKFLVVMNHSILPARCPVTNRQTPHDEPVSFRKVVWTPASSMKWLFLFRGLAFVMSALGKRVSGRLSYPLSAGVKARMWTLRLLGWLLIAGGIALIGESARRAEENATLSRKEPAQADYAALGLMLAGGVTFTFINPLRVRDHRNGWFKIAGCSKKYLQQLPEYTFDSLR